MFPACLIAVPKNNVGVAGLSNKPLITHRALCLASWARQLRLPWSKASSRWQRPHCWQKRWRLPARSNSGILMCTYAQGTFSSFLRHCIWAQGAG